MNPDDRALTAAELYEKYLPQPTAKTPAVKTPLEETEWDALKAAINAMDNTQRQEIGLLLTGGAKPGHGLSAAGPAYDRRLLTPEEFAVAEQIREDQRRSGVRDWLRMEFWSLYMEKRGGRLRSERFAAENNRRDIEDAEYGRLEAVYKNSPAQKPTL